MQMYELYIFFSFWTSVTFTEQAMITEQAIIRERTSHRKECDILEKELMNFVAWKWRLCSLSAATVCI